RVPGISFIDESLDYYERKLFKRKIIRAIHPSTARQLLDGIYHPPHWLPIDEALSLVPLEYKDIQDTIIEDEKLNPMTWTATGLRAADSAMRRKSIAVNGPKAYGKRTTTSIWDWNMEMVVSKIANSGIKLPPDYHLFGRTFDG